MLHIDRESVVGVQGERDRGRDAAVHVRHAGASESITAAASRGYSGDATEVSSPAAVLSSGVTLAPRPCSGQA